MCRRVDEQVALVYYSREMPDNNRPVNARARYIWDEKKLEFIEEDTMAARDWWSMKSIVDEAVRNLPEEYREMRSRQVIEGRKHPNNRKWAHPIYG